MRLHHVPMRTRHLRQGELLYTCRLTGCRTRSPYKRMHILTPLTHDEWQQATLSYTARSRSCLHMPQPVSHRRLVAKAHTTQHQQRADSGCAWHGNTTRVLLAAACCTAAHTISITSSDSSCRPSNNTTNNMDSAPLNAQEHTRGGHVPSHLSLQTRRLEATPAPSCWATLWCCCCGGC